MAHACARPTAPPSAAYERRQPETTVLYQTLQTHWRTFLAELDAAGGEPCLPAFVIAEVEAFLRCGVLAHGFVRVRCDVCNESRLVAFTCKRRGFCPSCLGRRMCDFAAHTVDAVIPRVPVRQWVLTLPHALRLRAAYDPALLGRFLRTFVAAISSHLRRKARRMGLRGRLQTGGVTVIQRCGSALNLNPHFHTIMVDGVFQARPDGPPLFLPVSAPTDGEVARVAAAVARKLQRRLERRRGEPEDDALAGEQASLAAVAAASVAGLFATGARRGQRVLHVGRGAWAQAARVLGKRCADVDGFNLHANVRIGANDRRGLEHLARYLARPPIAADRLEALPDGRVALRFKRAFSDGAEAVVFQPREFIEKLLPLIPRPRTHGIRFHGVLAPAAADRAAIVPRGAPTMADVAAKPAPPRRPGRIPWADLLRRVFLVDVLDCPRCHGRMRVLAAVTQPAAVERLLRHQKLPAEPPRVFPARPPPQPALDFSASDPEYADPPAHDDFAA